MTFTIALLWYVLAATIVVWISARLWLNSERSLLVTLSEAETNAVYIVMAFLLPLTALACAVALSIRSGWSPVFPVIIAWFGLDIAFVAFLDTRGLFIERLGANNTSAPPYSSSTNTQRSLS